MAADRFDVSTILRETGTAVAAERLGVDVRTVQRWIRNGVNVYTADRIAVKLDGNHPAFIWGRDWLNA